MNLKHVYLKFAQDLLLVFAVGNSSESRNCLVVQKQA